MAFLAAPRRFADSRALCHVASNIIVFYCGVAEGPIRSFFVRWPDRQGTSILEFSDLPTEFLKIWLHFFFSVTVVERFLILFASKQYCFSGCILAFGRQQDTPTRAADVRLDSLGQSASWRSPCWTRRVYADQHHTIEAMSV
jgi:hypothetical protein